MINFYTEDLNDKLFKELLPLLDMAKKEVYDIKDNQALSKSMVLNSIDDNNVNYNYFKDLQSKGLLNICTMRNEKNELVGHWTLNLSFHPQSKNLLIAYCQNLFIISEYRKNNNSIRFIKYTEEVLKKRGVKSIFFGVNPMLNTDRLLKMLGYSIEEIVLSKEL